MDQIHSQQKYNVKNAISFGIQNTGNKFCSFFSLCPSPCRTNTNLKDALEGLCSPFNPVGSHKCEERIHSLGRTYINMVYKVVLCEWKKCIFLIFLFFMTMVQLLGKRRNKNEQDIYLGLCHNSVSWFQILVLIENQKVTDYHSFFKVLYFQMSLSLDMLRLSLESPWRKRSKIRDCSKNKDALSRSHWHGLPKV